MIKSDDILLKVTSTVQELIGERTAHMRQILARYNNTESNSVLAQFEVTAPVVRSGQIYWKLELEDYYDYIDKGVKGIGGGVNMKQSDGVYSFKTPFVGRGMVGSIQNWIARKPIRVRQSKQESGKAVMTRAKSMAFAIAKNVKKSGIQRTHFVTIPFDDKQFEKFNRRLSTILGKEIELQIKDL